MPLPPGEPAAGPWRVEPLARVVETLLDRAGPVRGRPVVVAVDGRSSSGKSTLARRVGESVAGVALVHTDDIAWHQAFFDWASLLAEGVLRPARAGRQVSYRPPAWDARNRPGAIEVPAGRAILVVEGVGSSRRQLAPLLDASVWVQSDLPQIERRNAVRVRAGELTESTFQAWMGEEDPFLADERPWERADLVVAGTPELRHDPRTELVVADGHLR